MWSVPGAYADTGKCSFDSDSIHGELAPESGDAYFAYGRALLQHAIQQNTVLGDSKRQDEAAAASTASSEAKPSRLDKDNGSILVLKLY